MTSLARVRIIVQRHNRQVQLDRLEERFERLGLRSLLAGVVLSVVGSLATQTGSAEFFCIGLGVYCGTTYCDWRLRRTNPVPEDLLEWRHKHGLQWDREVDDPIVLKALLESKPGEE